MFLKEAAGRTEKPALLMHDWDTKFTSEFVRALEARSIQANAFTKASPNLNGRCKRVMQTLKFECLRTSLFSASGTWTTS